MPGKPEISPGMILSQLDEVTSVQSATDIQSACVLSVLDAVDRKLLRENVYEVLREAIVLYSACGKLRMAISIRDHLEKGSLTKEMCDTAVKDIVRDSEAHREKLLSLMRVQTQCPEEGIDAIN